MSLLNYRTLILLDFVSRQVRSQNPDELLPLLDGVLDRGQAPLLDSFFSWTQAWPSNSPTSFIELYQEYLTTHLYKHQTSALIEAVIEQDTQLYQEVLNRYLPESLFTTPAVTKIGSLLNLHQHTIAEWLKP
jgi:hypothetical protein